MTLSKTQLKNIVAFCTIMESEGGVITKSPDYIAEKFQRYIGGLVLKDKREWPWGMHPIIKKVIFDNWVTSWYGVDEPTEVEELEP